MTFRCRLVALVVLMLPVARVQAAPITYTDRTAFELALGQIEIFDFSNPTVTIEAAIGMDRLSYDGLTVFVDRASGQTTIDAVRHGKIANPTHAVQLAFSSPRSAFGFDVNEVGDFRIGARGLDGGWESLGSFEVGHSGFFGVIFSSQIAGATIFPWDANGHYAKVTVDNMTTNRIPVPEPAYLWLFSVVAAGLIGRRRR